MLNIFEMNLSHCSSTSSYKQTLSVRGSIFLFSIGQHHPSFSLDASSCWPQYSFNWSATLPTASTGIQNFPLLQLVFNYSHCFNWSPTLFTDSTDLPVRRINVSKLNSYLTYINPQITCIFINRIISIKTLL